MVLYGDPESLGKAKVQNSRLLSRNFDHNYQESVNIFRGKFKELDKEGAFEVFEDSALNKEERLEMLKIVVDSGKKNWICDVLQQMNSGDIDNSTSDDLIQSVAYEKAVLCASMNNDPGTLEAILDWGMKHLGPHQIREMVNASDSVDNNPILLCSLEHYSACLELLYKSGYRINLPERDEKRIKAILSLNLIRASNIQVDYTLKNEEHGFWKKIFFLSKVDEKQSIDPVEQFLIFQAHCNPFYTQIAFTETYGKNKEDLDKMKILDPIRRSFALSKYVKLLAHQIPEHYEGYQKIRNKCDEFTKSVLEQCNNREDIKIILGHSPVDVEDERTNWHLALWEEQKPFVAHPYYQHFQWGKMTNHVNWDSYYFLQRILMYFSSLLVFFCYPLIVMFDSIVRDSDILFISPTKLKSMQKKKTLNHPGDDKAIEMNDKFLPSGGKEEKPLFESCLFGFFRKRMHRPIYRMFICGSLDIVFLICLFMHILDIQDGISPTDKSYYSTIITYFFVANYLFEDIVNISRLNWNFFSSPWSIYTLLTNLLLSVGGILAWVGHLQSEKNEKIERANLGGNDPINIGMTLISLGACLSFFRIIRWFLLHKQLGPVILCIVKVMKDVLHVLIIFAIIYIAFSVGLWSMFKPFQNCEGTTHCIQEKKLTNSTGFRGIMSILFWRVFNGDFSSAEVYRTAGNQTDKDVSAENLSLEFSHFMGVTFFAVYQGLTVILLINILIAMMNSTYSKVWENADKEWKYCKTFYKVQFLRPRESFPPPFRWFYYFAFFMRKLKLCCKAKKADDQIETFERKKRYFELMNKLIKTKMQEDEEKSLKANFDDLKKDILNKMDEIMRKMKNDN